jgi:hypothetical protein
MPCAIIEVPVHSQGLTTSKRSTYATGSGTLMSTQPGSTGTWSGALVTIASGGGAAGSCGEISTGSLSFESAMAGAADGLLGWSGGPRVPPSRCARQARRDAVTHDIRYEMLFLRRPLQ